MGIIRAVEHGRLDKLQLWGMILIAVIDVLCSIGYENKQVAFKERTIVELPQVSSPKWLTTHLEVVTVRFFWACANFYFFLRLWRDCQVTWIVAVFAWLMNWTSVIWFIKIFHTVSIVLEYPTELIAMVSLWTTMLIVQSIATVVDYSLKDGSNLKFIYDPYRASGVGVVGI